MSVSPTQAFRRNLPHWRRDGAIYSVTFRLADSLPQTLLTELRHERTAWLQDNPEPWTSTQFHEHEVRFGERVQQWLDAGYGSCSLARSDVREAVRACLTRFDGVRLHLHAAVIMPNHVHALIEPRDEDILVGGATDIPVGAPKSNPQARMPVSPNPQAGMPVSPSPLSALLKGIKGASARAANALVGHSGTFWMDESYDRIVRSEKEYLHFVDYIRANPGNAGLSPDRYWLHLK